MLFRPLSRRLPPIRLSVIFAPETTFDNLASKRLGISADHSHDWEKYGDVEIENQFEAMQDLGSHLRAMCTVVLCLECHERRNGDTHFGNLTIGRSGRVADSLLGKPPPTALASTLRKTTNKMRSQTTTDPPHNHLKNTAEAASLSMEVILCQDVKACCGSIPYKRTTTTIDSTVVLNLLALPPPFRRLLLPPRQHAASVAWWPTHLLRQPWSGLDEYEGVFRRGLA
ncbi:hypothetical protein C8F01DRAFT_1245585 [Mycena amicta]|nr:hypothetical protein C8F01DRAFT_1245585 [Mycena amicta]